MVKFWERLVVFNDLLTALLVYRNSKQQIFSRIFFQSTVLVSKPLWAVTAEKFGTEVIIFHYAIASEPTLGSNPVIQDGIWQLNSWNSAWVVDEQQVTEIALSTAYPPTDYFEIGVPFWGGEGDLHELPKDFPIVSVFDTDISAGTKFSAGKLDELGWNERSLEVEFIKIILEAASSFKVTIAHKKKRAIQDEFSSLRKTETMRLLELYSSHYHVVDSLHSSDLLISKSAMVISKPVSTTAVAAKLMGIESIFLDPPGNIHFEDPSLRNLKILRNVAELKAVFAQHFEKL
jgi:polysaccharide biosynthesis PFTS motif protein